MEFALQKTLSSAEVKLIRQKLNLKQRELAEFVNVSVKTVEYWERNGGQVKGSAAALLCILRERAGILDEFRVPEKNLPVRLKYMYGEQLCTVIDVDDRTRRVRIKNFVTDPLFRAFGRTAEPTYEEYEEFLESRCFPPTRDKMKIILKLLSSPRPPSRYCGTCGTGLPGRTWATNAL